MKSARQQTQRSPVVPLTAGTTNGWAIEVHDLHKYFGATKAVDGIDLSIASGEIVAIVGPNGAGKSTTIDMVLGLTRPSQGSVRVLERDPREAVAAGAVGAMLQTGGLPQHLSVAELITMIASLYSAPMPVPEVFARTGLSDLASKPTSKLSGGESQRVRFAIALVSNPDLLVLDEPTVAFDVEARHEFWESMRGLATRGRTVVFATHYLEEADAFADRIILMARGHIVADGSPTEIKGVVGVRTIRTTLINADVHSLERLKGVTSVERHGDSVNLYCQDSDVALRALLWAHPDARDIEVVGAGLDAAFVQLTGDASGANSDAREGVR